MRRPGRQARQGPGDLTAYPRLLDMPLWTMGLRKQQTSLDIVKVHLQRVGLLAGQLDFNFKIFSGTAHGCPLLLLLRLCKF